MTALSIQGGRFAVVGGASLVGSNIVNNLLDEGAAAVTVVDNFSLAAPESIAALRERKGVSVVQADVVRLDELLPAFKGVDGVCHAAALLTSVLSPRPGLGIDVNIRGTLNVLSAAAAVGVKKVVLSSTVGVYGSTPGKIREDMPFDSAGMGPATALYTLSKLVGEQLCALFNARKQVATVSLRYSSIYGPGLHSRGLNTAAFLNAYERIRAGQPPRVIGDGSDQHDYLYVGDVATANVQALKTDVSGEAFTIATGRSSSAREAVQTMLELCGRTDLGIENQVSDTPTYHPPGETSYDTAKAQDVLGWQAKTDLRTGLQRLIEWLEHR